MRDALACLLGVPSLAAAACSPSSDTADAGVAGGCPAYVSTADLTSPSVSFARDVMPIFGAHCAAGGASCHGDPSVVAASRPLLGLDATDAAIANPAATILAGLVGAKSKEDQSMDLVAPGDPGHSFLMHKMDGDQCRLIPDCMVAGSFRPNCGVAMPYQAATLLDPTLRDTVRRWIAQGAAND